MEVRVGLRESGRELAFESNQNSAELEKIVTDALASNQASIKFTDDKGRLFIVPSTALAYIEIGADQARRVGFIA